MCPGRSKKCVPEMANGKVTSELKWSERIFVSSMPEHGLSFALSNEVSYQTTRGWSEVSDWSVRVYIRDQGSDKTKMCSEKWETCTQKWQVRTETVSSILVLKLTFSPHPLPRNLPLSLTDWFHGFYPARVRKSLALKTLVSAAD